MTEVLGYDGDKDLDIKVIMARHGLPFDFPDDVKKEAAKIDTTVTLEEGRRDYRDRQLITIDSEDAKDLDDAIDVENSPTVIFDWASILPTSVTTSGLAQPSMKKPITGAPVSTSSTGSSPCCRKYCPTASAASMKGRSAWRSPA